MTHRKSMVLAIAGFAALAAPLAIPAVQAQSVARITFAKGNDNASVNGTITGKQYRDYKIRVGAGQNLGVSLVTKGSAYFNILPPGSKDVAVYNSSTSGNDATGIETVAGDYTIRVYLMGSAEYSKKPVSYQMSVSVL